jgi:hypothetical protein
MVRDWIATRLFDLSARLFAAAESLRTKGPTCADCELGEIVDGRCAVCDERNARDREMGRAEEAAAHKAWAEAEQEFAHGF